MSDFSISDNFLSAITEKAEKHGLVPFRGINTGTPLSIVVSGKVRFVKLSLQKTSSFHLDEVEVYDDTGANIAQGRQVIVSSMYADNPAFDGSGVVNGNKNGGCGFHSKREKNPWILLDLGEIREVSKIVVYNRDDEHFSRALSLKVEVSNNLTDWTEVFDNWSLLKQLDVSGYSRLEHAVTFAALLDEEPLMGVLSELQKIDNQHALEVYSIVNGLVSRYGVSLGPHGFTLTFALTSEQERRKIFSEVSQLCEWITEFGCPAFVSYGTLLGIVREGDLIAHDDDVDINYISRFNSEAEILKEREELVRYLNDKGCKLSQSNLAHYWCRTPQGVGIDIFTSWMEDNRCILNPAPRAGVEKSSILPLSSREIFGVSVPVPAVPEDFLTLNYGENWRTPDPLWKFDWSNARSEYEFLYFD